MEEFLLKTQYIVGSMFLLTGCLMYFLERLVSSAVHISGNFVNKYTTYLPGIVHTILFIYYYRGNFNSNS